jgi:hypothetical protein
MRAKASFFHDNQVPHPKYQYFCAVMSARLRKSRANEVPLCFRCSASLRGHPHMYHQRSVPSRIHWQLHVKGAVSCPPYTVQPCRKSLRKSFVIHWFERSTVWCWLLVLKMSSSAAAHAHKSWPSWLWRHNPSPPPHFSKSIVAAFRCSNSRRKLFENMKKGGWVAHTRRVSILVLGPISKSWNKNWNKFELRLHNFIPIFIPTFGGPKWVGINLLYWNCLFQFPNLNVPKVGIKIGTCWDYVPQIFQITYELQDVPQFEIVSGPDRKHTISTCSFEAKKQNSRPSLWTCPSLFSGIKRDNNVTRDLRQ